MSNQLVSNLTVDELKDLIASVVDNRLNNLLRSSELNFAKSSAELKFVRNPNILRSANYPLSMLKPEGFDMDKKKKPKRGFAQRPSGTKDFILDTVHKSALKEDNPWLKIAGIHKNNPLFERVIASIEADRQDGFEEDLI